MSDVDRAEIPIWEIRALFDRIAMREVAVDRVDVQHCNPIWKTSDGWTVEIFNDGCGGMVVGNFDYIANVIAHGGRIAEFPNVPGGFSCKSASHEPDGPRYDHPCNNHWRPSDEALFALGYLPDPPVRKPGLG